MPLASDWGPLPQKKTTKSSGSTGGPQSPAPNKDGVFSQLNYSSSWDQLLQQKQAAAAAAPPEPFANVDTSKLFPSEQARRDAVNPFSELPAGFSGGLTYGGTTTALEPTLTKPSAGPAPDPFAAQEKLGAHMAAKEGGRRRDVYEMTWEDYQKLTDQQRAAVDFNTMLAGAVRRDLKNQQEYASVGQGARDIYDQQVAAIFGADGGSKIYAPNTVALLKQVNFHDDTGDLDRFLKMRSAITDADLAGLQLEAVPGLGVPYSDAQDPGAMARREQAAALSSGTQAALDAVMANTPALLATPRKTALVERNASLQMYGVQGVTPKQPPGWGDPNISLGNGVRNYDFQQAFEWLSSSNLDDAQRGQIMDRMRQSFTPEQQQQFLAYADQRSKQAMEAGRPLGSDPQIPYVDAQVLRKYLGLGK